MKCHNNDLKHKGPAGLGTGYDKTHQYKPLPWTMCNENTTSNRIFKIKRLRYVLKWAWRHHMVMKLHENQGVKAMWTVYGYLHRQYSKRQHLSNTKSMGKKTSRRSMRGCGPIKPPTFKKPVIRRGGTDLGYVSAQTPLESQGNREPPWPHEMLAFGVPVTPVHRFLSRGMILRYSQ